MIKFKIKQEIYKISKGVDGITIHKNGDADLLSNWPIEIQKVALKELSCIASIVS